MGKVAVEKLLQGLTRDYLAIEGVLRSPSISPTTRQKLEGFLSELDKEIAQALREHLLHHN
jgi:hypothetical protein